MAIVKISFVQHAQSLLSYVMRERGSLDPIFENDCRANDAHKDFESEALAHGGKGTVQAVHVVQSWSKDDSTKLAFDDANAMGRQLAEEQFPGHAFVVVTHTHTGKTHNHIVVCPWHRETGRKIENKKFHLEQLRTINDRLCRERGLSIVNRAAKDRDAKLPEVVKTITKFNGRSYLLDICQKADFARAWSTSYDEYAGILSGFGITARVEDKNISYSYPGRERAKRGSKLGKKYDKVGLESTFKENDIRFRADPALREKIRGTIDQLRACPESRPVLAAHLKAHSSGAFREGHDYSVYTKIPRCGEHDRYPHELDLRNSLLPVHEIQSARKANILEYCRRNKIGLEKETDGTWTMTGRPHVKITETEWINKKNRTRGSLIELVAAHKNMTFLQAIADINNNPRLLLLEKHFGETPRTFTSFYVPKAEQSSPIDSVRAVSRLLRSRGVQHDVAFDLLSSGQVHVDRHGVIRFFGKDDEGGALEFREDPTGEWKQSVRGRIRSAFYSQPTSGSKGTVFADPFAFLIHAGRNPMAHRSDLKGNLCLLHPESEVVDRFVAENRTVKDVRCITSERHQTGGAVVDFFQNLRNRYQAHSLSIDIGSTTDLSRSRSHDISFH